MKPKKKLTYGPRKGTGKEKNWDKNLPRENWTRK